jgi:hypothetical protein
MERATHFIFESFCKKKKKTHHQRTLGPAADDGLDEIMDAAALLALSDRRDKVVLAQDKVVVPLI